MSNLKSRAKRQSWRIAIPGAWLRWLLSLLTIFIVLGGIYWGCQWFSDPTNLPLERVVIHAPYQHVARATLEQHIAPYVNKNFVTLNAVKLRRELHKLAWIKKVQLKRVWPDTIIVTVEEQQPLARWGNEGVLSVSGEIFNPEPESIPTDLPVFDGPVDMAKAMVSNYREFQSELDKENLKIVALKVNPRHAWELRLEGGTVLKLGQGKYLERLGLVVKAWPKLTKERTVNLNSIDARYTNGVAVQ